MGTCFKKKKQFLAPQNEFNFGLPKIVHSLGAC